MATKRHTKHKERIDPVLDCSCTTIHKNFHNLRKFSLEAHSSRSAALQSISICPGRRAPRRFLVAQICNLLYRRIVFCGGLGRVSRWVTPNGQPIANRRYGRVQLCATLVAAAPRCAVSPTCSRQTKGESERVRHLRHEAGYNLAIRQSTNLRYSAVARTR